MDLNQLSKSKLIDKINELRLSLEVAEMVKEMYRTELKDKSESYEAIMGYYQSLLEENTHLEFERDTLKEILTQHG